MTEKLDTTLSCFIKGRERIYQLNINPNLNWIDDVILSEEVIQSINEKNEFVFLLVHTIKKITQ